MKSDLLEVVVTADCAGQRLDRFLCVQHALGRAAARRLIAAQQVWVNGRAVTTAAWRLTDGDRVQLPLPVDKAAAADPDLPLSVVYADAWLVIADKPAAVPSHPLRPGERGSLASALVARYPEMAAVGYSPREPGIVHRLDTDTSGLLLAARDASTFAALRKMLEQSAIDKRYLALCIGEVAAPATHQAWLSARGPRVTVRFEPFATAEPICTQVLHARPAGAFSLLEIRVHRARRHQIRAHLAALGHPIVADTRYGGPAMAGLSRHFLHASALHFSHPQTGSPLSVEAPLPLDLERALRER